MDVAKMRCSSTPQFLKKDGDPFSFFEKNQSRQHVNIFDKQNEWLKSLKIKTNYGARQHVNIF